MIRKEGHQSAVIILTFIERNSFVPAHWFQAGLHGLVFSGKEKPCTNAQKPW
jgi:hypothetical protein